MAAGSNDINLVELAWGFYLEKQSVQHVIAQCAQAGHRVHRNTVSKWVNRGVVSKGVVPFKERFAKLRGVAAEVVKVKRKPQQVEVSQVVDLKTIEVAAAQLDQWRTRVDRAADTVDMLLDRARELLRPRVDEEGNPLFMSAKDLQMASSAVKVAFDSMKRAAETHDILKATGGTDDDGRDVWMQENFEGWTREEHDDFMTKGIWPARLGDVPEFMVLPEEVERPPDLPEPEDSEYLDEDEESEELEQEAQQ